MVVSVDRGRWGCVLGGDPDRPVVTMRARELGRTPIVVGDRVDVVGDLSGKPDTLARIVRVSERSTVLRRTADDTDPYERIVVANAQQLLIVVALAAVVLFVAVRPRPDWISSAMSNTRLRVQMSRQSTIWSATLRPRPVGSEETRAYIRALTG